METLLEEIGHRIASLLRGKTPATINAEAYEAGLPRDCAEVVNDLIGAMNEVWAFILPLSQGKLSVASPRTANLLASPFKALHARLLHLAWQAQQITKGDYSQRIDFLGDFSKYFNHMVEMIDSRERLLKSANDDLSRALGELKRSQAMLVESEKLSALGRLLAQLSHELNNPINVIKNNVDPLREYLSEISNAFARVDKLLADLPQMQEFEIYKQTHDLQYILSDSHAALKIVEDAAQRISTIYENLRTFIRGDKPNAQMSDITPGIKATAAMLSPKNLPGVSIELELAELPMTWVYAGELNQVFFNLIKNALDSIGDTGKVYVRTFLDKNRDITIEITDDGPGIPADIADKIFDPFFTTKGVGGGTGLGLSISREIALRHQGTLKLDTTYTHGSRFVVRLPVRADPDEYDHKAAS